MTMFWLQRGGDADRMQVSALQRRIDSLESKVAKSQAPTQVPVPREPNTPQAVDDRPGADTRSRAGAIQADQAAPPFADAEAAAERRRYEVGILEQKLATEQLDVAATNTFTEGLKQAFSDEPELAGNQIMSAQCRVTLCRIAVLQRSEDDTGSFLGQLGSLPGLENTETYWQRQLNPDGSSVMTMYIARQGQKMPDYHAHVDEGLPNRDNP